MSTTGMNTAGMNTAGMNTAGMNTASTNREMTEGNDMRTAPQLGAIEGLEGLEDLAGLAPLGLDEASTQAALMSCSTLMESDGPPAANVVQSTAWMGQLRTLPLLSPWAVMQGHHALLEAALAQSGVPGWGAATGSDAGAGTAQLAVVGLLAAPDAESHAQLQRCSGDGGWV